MSTRSTAFAIAIGGVAGAVAALFGATSTPERAAGSAPLKPIAQAASTAPALPSAAAPSTAPVVASANSAPSVATQESAATATAQASAAPLPPEPASSTAQPTPSAPAPPAVAVGPLPDSKAALLKVEMRCDQRDAAACELAAAAYDQGSAGVTDPAKAANYRKIGLTHWITQCDKASATACITLAERYRSGTGVPQNERNADALIERARELCKVNPAAACADLPK